MRGLSPEKDAFLLALSRDATPPWIGKIYEMTRDIYEMTREVYKMTREIYDLTNHLMSSLSLIDRGLQVSPVAAAAFLEILRFLRNESWSKKSIMSLRFSLLRARPSSPLSSSLSLGLESDSGALGIERSGAPRPSLLSRMSRVLLSMDLSCGGRLSVASRLSLSNLSRRWLIERRSLRATETTSRGVVAVVLEEEDGVTRVEEDVRLEERLAGSGLVEVASVCSSTDCEALVINSPVSRRAMSGDISIARKVARN